MQEGLNTSPTWIQTAAQWVVSFLVSGGILKIINVWLNRKKPAAELHVTEETATEIRLRSHSTATDIVVKMMNRLDEAQITIDRVRGERDAWEEQYGEVFTEKERLKVQNGKLQDEMKLYDEEMRRMRATLELKDTNYDNTKDQPIT